MSPSKVTLLRTALALGWVTLLLLPSAQASLQNDLGIQLIPQPAQLTRHEGFFQIDARTVLVADTACADLGRLVRDRLTSLTGLPIPTQPAGQGTPPPRAIVLRLLPTLDALGPEGYQMEITRTGATLEAPHPAGLFYACQTLFQLLPLPRVIGLPPERIQWVLPCLTLQDQPRFPWRGLMLDCSRTFQSVDYLRQTLDRMAAYKMNRLHLHLTDDQGWRLEIKKHPQLTQKGARFPERWQEPASHQGFYSQQQIKELIHYAAARHITIIPEIEMPGHALAALACYPQLSCTGGPFEIHPFFQGPGIHEDIFCAGREETFAFLEEVLTEVIDLFPSPYLHIGGDEAPKARWKNCPRCQARLQAEGLRDEHELQSYFIRRIARFVQAQGRHLIGWDEILEGGLAPGAAVMSWRGTQGGIAAAQAGHDVVMSPTSHCYFDYSYDQIDSARAYQFEPVPDSLSPDQARHILGLQANFWSHIDRDPARVDHQLFPRLLAIAERGWSPATVRDAADFAWRLQVHLVHLDELGIAYRRPDPAPFVPPVGTWTPAHMSETYQPLTWNVTDQITGPGRYHVLLRYTRGGHRLGIEKVELLANGQPVSTDAHRGMTGGVHEANRYTLTLEQHQSGIRYEIRASARSEGGTDSNGEVFFMKE